MGSSIYSYGTNTTNRLKRITPISTVGYTAINVDFAWYVDPGYSGTTTEGVIIQWSTDGATWTSAGTTWMRYGATAQWVVNTQNLPVGAENQATLYIAFLFNSNFGNDCHMDIIHVKGTAAPAPTVTTTAATSVLGTTATLNGTVNANGISTAVSFEYGTTVAYGTSVPGVPSPVTGSTVTPVLANITGLTPSTLYHFRCNGTTSGTVNGNDMTFTTAALAPSVVTLPATATTATGATMNGTVNANGASTAVSFDYGLTVAYGTNVAGTPTPVTGNAITPVSATLTGLSTNTTYHFRVKGINSIGTTLGADQTFFTACALVAAAGVVTGPASVCSNSTGYVYTVPVIANATYYNWTLPTGATITAGNNTNSITVSYSGAAVSGNISVYGSSICGNGTVSPNLAITVNAQPLPTITGAATVCAQSTGNVYTTQAGMTGYTWTVTGGVVTAGGTASSNTVTITWNTAGVQTICVNYTNGVGCTASAPVCYNVTVNALPVPTVIGPASPCANSTGNVYTTQAGMTGYVWTLSAGGTITAGVGTNSIMVNWSAAGAQTVCVNYANATGCMAAAPACYNVTVNPLPVPAITGLATVCNGSSNVVYTTQAGMSNYLWSVSSGGVITAGGTSTSNTMTVTWTTAGAQAVCVNYTSAAGCTAAAATCYNVQVNPAPTPTIGSNNAPCVGSTGNMYYTESGMTNYTWTVTAGGSIASGQGTNAINVTWTGVGAQSVAVNYSNASLCAAITPTVYNLFVNPLPNAAGAVTGTATLCAGTNGVAYSCAEILNATSYTWTLPAGATIATGAGTKSITVNFSPTAVSGNILVSGTNSCGNGTASPTFAITVNPLPAAAGAITGAASVCVNATGIAYSVPAIANATGYVWTVPAGATITSGSATKSIVVSYGPTAGSGVITVKGTNACGNGTVSSNFNVTMNAIPSAPVVTAAGAVLTSSASSGNQWYYAGAGIAGATSQSYTVTHNTGYYWCVVTTNGCSSAISNKVWVVVTGQQELQSSNFNIYPVPSDGRFTVTIASPVQEYFSIGVFNQLGAKIFELGNVPVNGAFEKEIDLRPIATGVYSVVFFNSEHKVVKKLIINR